MKSENILFLDIETVPMASKLEEVPEDLRHLFIAGEMLAAQIASEHNLAFYLELVRQARLHIEQGDFLTWKNETVRRLETRL